MTVTFIPRVAVRKIKKKRKREDGMKEDVLVTYLRESFLSFLCINCHGDKKILHNEEVK